MPTLALPLWAMVLLIGLPCGTILTVLLVWWRLNLLNQEHHTESLHILNNITAIAQTIAAQNRDVLRRLEELGP
jgi:hypothetical protein